MRVCARCISRAGTFPAWPPVLAARAEGTCRASEMREAVKRIEAIQEMPSARSFWWVATAFLTALAEGAAGGC
jgi:hypothetical protein